MKQDCKVGFWASEDEFEVVSLPQLKDLIFRRWKSNERFRKSGSYYFVNRDTNIAECAKGESPCFEPFQFCPVCGKKIQWDKILKEDSNG